MRNCSKEGYYEFFGDGDKKQDYGKKEEISKEEREARWFSETFCYGAPLPEGW